MKLLQEQRAQHKVATERILAYLAARDDTFAVSRTEEDDIHGDEHSTLVWYYSGPKGVVPLNVLVRGDRFHTDALYFETTRDQNDCPGGSDMMLSKAVYLFYYYLDNGTTYIIPLQQFREWVMENIDSFEPRRTVVPVGDDHRVALGRMIPLQNVEKFARVQKVQA